MLEQELVCKLQNPRIFGFYLLLETLCTGLCGLPSDRIDGGAIRGSNLFHSFQEFNIGEGRGAYFTNPTAIENIFSRVTGDNPSRLFGTLGGLGQCQPVFSFVTLTSPVKCVIIASTKDLVKFIIGNSTSHLIAQVGIIP